MFAFRVEGVEKRTFSYSKHAPKLTVTLYNADTNWTLQHVRVILVFFTELGSLRITLVIAGIELKAIAPGGWLLVTPRSWSYELLRREMWFAQKIQRERETPVQRLCRQTRLLHLHAPKLITLGGISPIIPSAPKCSSRHFIFILKCVSFEWTVSIRVIDCFSSQKHFYSQPNYSSWRFVFFVVLF